MTFRCVLNIGIDAAEPLLSTDADPLDALDVLLFADVPAVDAPIGERPLFIRKNNSSVNNVPDV